MLIPNINNYMFEMVWQKKLGQAYFFIIFSFTNKNLNTAFSSHHVWKSYVLTGPLLLASFCVILIIGIRLNRIYADFYWVVVRHRHDLVLQIRSVLDHMLVLNFASYFRNMTKNTRVNSKQT